MSKHTPGPWVWIDNPSGPWPKLIGPDEEGGWIAMSSDPNGADGRLIAAAPELDAYRQYVEDNLERIERGGWTPVCFAEFTGSEWCANHMKREEA